MPGTGSNNSTKALLAPYMPGDLKLKNRIVMAFRVNFRQGCFVAHPQQYLLLLCSDDNSTAASRFIGISSNMVGLAIPGMSHYIATKMGIIGFMRGVANDVAGDGVTANTVLRQATLSWVLARDCPSDMFVTRTAAPTESAAGQRAR
jgi:NAD(P)-dependent dehydrogenase (short-subunit alcohol dehydrogenase family)